MAIIFIESRGFSATHVISDMLRLDRRTAVSHGVKNFNDPNPQANDLPFEIFLAEMTEKQKKFENCISVHSLYDQSLISRAAATAPNVKFYGLARKSQKNQIISCMSWALNNLLDGRQGFMEILSQIHLSHKASLNKIGLASNLLTCSALYAMTEVLRYNATLALNAERVFLMEQIMSNPKRFAEEIGVKSPDDVDVKIQKGNSHKNKLKQYNFFPEIDDTVRILLENFSAEYNGNLFKVGDVETLLQKAS